MLQLSETQQRHFLQNEASEDFLKFLSECFLNVYQGNVPTNRNYVKKYEKPFRMILNPKISYKKRRQIFSDNLRLTRTVTISCGKFLESLHNVHRRVHFNS